MNAEPKIGIVIVNYNGLGYQNECLESIFTSDYENTEVILVDSNSSDNSQYDSKEKFPRIVLIECDENVGVAKGNNIGIEKSIELGCEYTLLLNNDTVLERDTISKIASLASPDTIVVPLIMYFDQNDLIWYGGGSLDWFSRKGQISKHENEGMRLEEYEDNNRYVTYAPTCCMLIHNSVFDKIGKIDETYFMYYDDTDFCARIDGDESLHLLYTPNSKLYHKVSSSSGGPKSKISEYYCTRNQLLFLRKYKEKCGNKASLYIFAKNLAKTILGTIKGSNDIYAFYGVRDFRKSSFGRNDDWPR